MPTAGIVIADWKLAAFKEALDKGGYLYTEQKAPILTGGILLKVKCSASGIGTLSDLIKATNAKTAN